MVRQELDRLVDEVLGDDPRSALLAYRDLADRQLPWIEQKIVALARREGLNWAEIGRLLGRSRQSVRERFATSVPKPAPGRYETAFERLLRRQNEAYERITRPKSAEDDDPVAW